MAQYKADICSYPRQVQTLWVLLWMSCIAQEAYSSSVQNKELNPAETISPWGLEAIPFNVRIKVTNTSCG